MTKLTKRQKEVLEYIKKESYIVGPTCRKIALHFGFSPQAAAEFINSLLEKKKIKKNEKGKIIFK